MQRVTTRSQAAPAPVSDENSNPGNAGHFRFTKRGSGIGGGIKPAPPPPGVVPTKPTLNTRKSSSTRAVLGDISNVQKTKDEQLPKKKRVEEVEKSSNGSNDMSSEVVIEDEGDDEQTQALERAMERRPSIQEKQLNFDDEKREDVDMREEERSLELIADLSLDLDSADVHNPQCVHEYINDIMLHLFESESKRLASPNYMLKQSDINVKMREILVDWLVEVHLKFKLQHESLYLTVNLIDRFLERRAVSRTKLQLVGCTAMLIAAKYEEIYAPEVRDFVYISDQAYTRDQILAMESIMLNTLGFYITVPTALRFGERLCRVAKVSPETEALIHYLMELTLQDSKFLRYRPSEIAAAAAYLGMKSTGHPWDATIEHHCGYTLSKLSEVLVDLQQLASRDPPKYRAVRKKYLNKKYFGVSAHVLL